MTHKKAPRSRTIRRRLARKAAKQARKAGLGENRVHAIASFEPGAVDAPPHLFDDCPYCRALAAVGASLEADGSVELTAAQHEEYERHLARFLAEGGLPDGAVLISPEQLAHEFVEAAAELAGRGAFDGVENMSDAELDILTMRVFRTMRERSLSAAGASAPGRN